MPSAAAEVAAEVVAGVAAGVAVFFFFFFFFFGVTIDSVRSSFSTVVDD